MPIPKDIRREHYGPKWDKLSKFLRAQAGHRCQCHGICGTDHGGRCSAIEGELPPAPPRFVDLFGNEWAAPEQSARRLTVAHLNQVAGDDRPENLLVMCAGCHLRYDRYQHARNRLETKRRKERAELEAAGQRSIDFETT